MERVPQTLAGCKKRYTVLKMDIVMLTEDILMFLFHEEEGQRS